MDRSEFIKKQVSDIFQSESNKLSNYKTRYWQISSQNVKCVIKRDDDIKDSDLELLELSRYISELEPNVETLGLINDVISSDITPSSKLQFLKLAKSHDSMKLFTQRYPKLIDMCEESFKDCSRL
jgi:hypothetical protein